MSQMRTAFVVVEFIANGRPTNHFDGGRQTPAGMPASSLPEVRVEKQRLYEMRSMTGLRNRSKLTSTLIRREGLNTFFLRSQWSRLLPGLWKVFVIDLCRLDRSDSGTFKSSDNH